MYTIKIYDLYTDELLATHTAASNAECEAWAEAQYGSNDTYWTY